MCYPLHMYMMSNKQRPTNSNNYCRFEMKWTSLKLFSHVFHWLIRCCKTCHSIEKFSYTNVCLYGRNEQFRDKTYHLIYLELVSNFQILFQSPCSACGAWKSLRSQTNHAPSVYAVPHYFPAAKQWTELYTIYDVFGKSALL